MEKSILSHLRAIYPENDGILHIYEMTKMKMENSILSHLRAILP